MLVIVMLLTDCGTVRQLPVTTEYLPAAPDYSDTTQWYITQHHAEADIFYITSTETGDFALSDGTICHFADTYNDSTRQPMLDEMRGVNHLLNPDLNYFAPYYRQCSLQTFTDRQTMSTRMPVALADIRQAFRYYLDHMNNGRPFILAGFSQGAMLLIELLNDMDKATYNRMIAAYAIGTAVNAKQARHTKHLIAAQSADDIGVTVCYNSVRDSSCIFPFYSNNTVAINPVNWKTDETTATLITQPSPNKPLKAQKCDTLTVHLDSKTHHLFVKGFTGDDYVLPLIGKDGNYHSREIWLYRTQLRENIALRTAVFLKKRKK